jgi:nicotinate-nucleotide adenylyltransferase
MKIAILGGSFDPPHLGHLFIALQVKELLDLDEVWLMPVSHHPFERNLSPIAIRLEMTKKLESQGIKTSDFEIKHNPESYTIDTLEGLQKLYPKDVFYWITGSDQLEHFQKYKNWQKILSNHNLIIFPREWMLPHLEEIVKAKLMLSSIPQNVIVLQTNFLLLTNISSTKMRERVKKKLPVHNFLPVGVETIIKKNKLYE